MSDADARFDKASKRLWERRTVPHAPQDIVVAVLLRSEDWRPLEAPWWRGKQVSIIGVDLRGNFLLRHSSGAVHYWDHATQKDEVLAKGIGDFVDMLR
jgi:hypothetical protein